MDPRKAINTQKNRAEHQYITKQTNRGKRGEQIKPLIFSFNIFIELKTEISYKSSTFIFQFYLNCIPKDF